MKITIIVAAILILGLIIFFGARQIQKNRPEPGLEDSSQITNADEESLPEPEGERITTSEGLVYQDITFGTGVEAETGDTVTVHYIGSLDNGTIFDASTQRGTPFSFRLGNGDVIEGWDIGVVGMKEGGIRELVIPPNLAYGDNEVGGGVIPTGSTLTFRVQLLQVQKP